MSATSYVIGGYRPGEATFVATSRSKPISGSIPCVFGHGFYLTWDPSLLRNTPYYDDFDGVTIIGSPVFMGELGGGSTWGNDNAWDAVDDVVVWAGSTYGTRTDKVRLIGESMGTLTVLNWAWRNPSKVAGIALRSPVVNLELLRDQNPLGLGAAAEAAYGGTAGFNAALPTHDPSKNTGLIAQFGRRVKLWYALSDDIVPPSSVTSFAAAIGAEAVPVAGEHEATITIDRGEIGSWLARAANL
jgi:pimeloyl-ACP methyl ester carboxylesterase